MFWKSQVKHCPVFWNSETVFWNSVQCPESSVQSLASRVPRPDSSIQGPASRVQRLESSVQDPASRAQCLESSVQDPASRVQRPESSVQHLSPESRNSGMWLLVDYLELGLYQKYKDAKSCQVLKLKIVKDCIGWHA